MEKSPLKTGKSPSYLYALDGIRTLAVLCIFLYHDWQQTWMGFPAIKIGNIQIPLEYLQRFGFLAVALFFVISGFCLFYPLARHDMEGGRDFDWKDFYIKRLRRIIPANYLIILVILIFPILTGSTYPMAKGEALFKQLLANLTFTQNLYLPAEGVFSSTIWTLAVEVQFYLLVPLIVWCFRKKPVATLVGMCLITWIYRYCMVMGPPIGKAQRMNTLAFLDDFAVGMAGAYVLVYLRNRFDVKRMQGYMTAISVACIPMIWQFFVWNYGMRMEGYDVQAYWRFFYRFPLCLVYVTWIISTCLSCKFWAKWVFGNRAMQFGASISYAFFLWHQNIHVMLNRLHIPHGTGVEYIREADDGTKWMYMFLTLAISITIATLSTYLIEKPIVKYGYKGAFRRLIGKKA